MQFLMVKMLSLSTFRRINLILLCLIAVAFTDPKYTKIRSIPAQARHIASDNLGNIYVITERNELVKYDQNGNLKFTYDTRSYGQLSFIDVRNPFKILLLYPEFSSIITLDNMLAQTNQVNLIDLGIIRVNAACRSHDDNLWIYDEQDFRLKKIDDDLNVIIESDELYTYFPDVDVKPNFMIARNDWVYLNEPRLGIMVFDLYGTYNKLIPIDQLTGFQVIDDQIVYYKDGQLTAYHLKTFQEYNIILPDSSDLNEVQIEKNRIYLLRKKQLDLYAY